MVYAAGLLGMLSPLRGLFIALTPFSLLLSYLLLCWNESERSPGVIRYLSLAFLLGFFVEVLGVNTGFPFGDYAYGTVLGPKIWATPMLIGINWSIVSFAANDVLRRIPLIYKHIWLFVLLGGAIPTLLDALIEPVAVDLGYWHWAGGGLPGWPNYAGWFVVSAWLAVAYRFWVKGAQNPIAPLLILLQFAFFAALCASLIC